MALAAPWRKLGLLLHVVTSIGLMGGVAGFLALALEGAATTEAVTMRATYLGMSSLTWWIIIPLAVLSLLVGVVQSLITPWGLVRYYWVIIKLVLTVLACTVLALQLPTILSLADAARTGNMAGHEAARFSMILHGTGGLLVLLVIAVLSVYKPRGMTQHGLRSLRSAHLDTVDTL